MKSVPKMIDGAAVLFFAPIDDSHRPTGYCSHFVGGSLLGPASGLAICQYENGDGFYLLYCDDDWNTLTDTFHETVERAREQAEREYEDVSQSWRKRAAD